MSDLLRAARCLALDELAARTCELLTRQGIPVLLIKGPVTVRYLYAAAPEQRTYSDVDLLVSPDRFDAAQAALATAGYRWRCDGLRPDESPDYETSWHAAELDITVDLHRGFHGVGDNQAFWTAVWAERAHLEVARLTVDVPGPVATAMMVALHAAAPATSAKPLRDLVSAIGVFDPLTWSDAATVAERVGAAGSFRAGLELVEEGRAVAAGLDLRAPVTADHWLAGRRSSRVSVHLAAVLQPSGAGGRMRFVLSKTFPSRAFLRLHDPRVRGGRVALARGYGRRWRTIVAGLPRAVIEVRQARRSVRARSTTRQSVITTVPRRVHRLVRLVAHGDLGTARAFLWAVRSLRLTRRRLAGGITEVNLTCPPALDATARSAVSAALRWRHATCLESSLLRQRFDAAAGRERDVIVGVTGPATGFRAHAWLDGDPQRADDFHEITRFSP